MSDALAIIGGSGFDPADHADPVSEYSLETPYGSCSAPLQLYKTRQRQWVFLPRHGVPHRIPPHRINYRANIWALRELGCTQIVAVNTVGGIAANAPVGAIVLPDQIIDYTHGREHTFSDGAADDLLHIDFTRPYSAILRTEVIAAASAAAIPLLDGGVYGAVQGPRLETAAEISRMQRDGCTLVGMTGMPEAALARELAIDYASLCLVVNLAAGRGGAMGIEDMHRVSACGMLDIAKIIGALCAR